MFFFTDSDGYEFIIVSLDNKSWHFEAQNVEVSELVDSNKMYESRGGSEVNCEHSETPGSTTTVIAGGIATAIVKVEVVLVVKGLTSVLSDSCPSASCGTFCVLTERQLFQAKSVSYSPCIVFLSTGER